MGASERALGEALGSRRDEAIIVSKFGMNYRDKPNMRDSSRERVHRVDRQEPEEPRHRLRRRVPRALARPEHAVRGDDAARSTTSCATGKVRFVGLSNFKLDEIEACMAVRRIDVVQYGWNMFDRRMQQRDPAVLRGAGRRLHGVRRRSRSGLLTGTFTEDHDFGSADWRARQGNMGAIKIFAALFGPEKFKDNVRAVDELKGVAARYGKSLAAARVALGDLAPGGEHRARRLPHRRRGRGQRRRGRLDDQRRRPRRDRRDLRRATASTPPPTSGSKRHDEPRLTLELAGKVAIVTGGASGLGRGDGRAVRGGGRAASSSPTSTPTAARRCADELGDAAAFKRDRRRRRRPGPGRRRLRGRAVRRAPRHVQQRRASAARSSAFLDDDFADFDRVMAVNIFGVMVGSQRAARHMAEHGGGVDRQHHVDRRDQRRARA